MLTQFATTAALKATRRTEGCLVLLMLTAAAAMGGSLPAGFGELPRAIAGEAYEARLHSVLPGTCRAGEAVWSVAAGVLPNGLRLDAVGLRGTPQEAGVHDFLLRQSNPCGSAEIAVRVVVSTRPVLSVSKNILEFEVEAGARTGPQSFLVSSDWPELAYCLSAAGALWLQFTPETGKTPLREAGMGADVVSVRVDPAKLEPGVYEAVLRVSAWRATNAPAIRIRLKVLPARG